MSALPAIVLLSLIGAPTPSPSPPTPPARLAQLVQKLGDKSYRAREDAARQLLLQGSAAIAVLKDGIKHDDPEISERCRQLLPQAASIERNDKLNQLLKDPKTPPPKGLAGLERFLKVTGDNPGAREIYAEMASLHYRALEAAETNPKEAAKLYGEFCTDAYNRYVTGARAGRHSYDNLFVTRADITFFLFLSADSRVRKINNGMANNSFVLLYGNQIPNAIDRSKGTAAMRQLFLDWLENGLNPNMEQQAFQLAAQAEIKEALPVAIKMLERKDTQPYSKPQIMIALIKLGAKEHIKVLDPHVTDKTQITTINFGNGKQMTIQLRDVAMGVQVQLAGQKMVDFGFDGQFGAGAGLSYHYYGFTDDKSRDDAHAKWKEWAGKNLTNPKDTPTPAKTPATKGPEKK